MTVTLHSHETKYTVTVSIISAVH